MNKTPWTVGRDSLNTREWGQWNHWVVTEDTGKLRQDSVDGNDTIHVAIARVSKEEHARLIALAPSLAAFIGVIAGSVKCSESESGQAAPEAIDGWIDHARSLWAKLEGGQA